MKNQLHHIIAQVKSNVRSAQEELYHYTYQNLLNCVLIYSKDKSDANWLFNVGMLNIYKSLDRYAVKTDYLAWASVILRRTAIDHYRKNKKHQENLAPVDIDDYTNQHQDLNAILEQIDTEIIMTAIQALPEKQRLIFSMYEIDGFSHVDIEKEVGIKKNTSKWLLSKAKASLKESLSQYYSHTKNSSHE